MKNLVWKLNCLRCSLVFHDQKLYDEHIKVHDTIIKRKSTEIDKPIKISKISTEHYILHLIFIIRIIVIFVTNH